MSKRIIIMIAKTTTTTTTMGDWGYFIDNCRAPLWDLEAGHLTCTLRSLRPFHIRGMSGCISRRLDFNYIVNTE